MVKLYSFRTGRTRSFISGDYVIIERLYINNLDHILATLLFFLPSLLPWPAWVVEDKLPNPLHLINQGLDITNNSQQYQEAIKIYDRALDIIYNYKCIDGFNYDEAREKIKSSKVHTYTCWGNILLSRDQNYQEALAKYDEALKIIPNDQKIKSLKSKVYYSWGCHMLLQGTTNYQRALDKFNDAIDLNPKESKYYASKAQTLNKLGKYDKAISVADKALQLDTSSEQAKHEKCYALDKQGEILLVQDNYEEALKVFDTILQLDPSNSEVSYKSFFAREMITVVNLENKNNETYEEEMTYLYQNEIDKKHQTMNILTQHISIEGYDHNKAKKRINNSMQYTYKCWARKLISIDHDYLGGIRKYASALLVNSNGEKLKSIQNKAWSFFGYQLKEKDKLDFEVALEKYTQANDHNPRNSAYNTNKTSVINTLGKNEEALHNHQVTSEIKQNNCHILNKSNIALEIIDAIKFQNEGDMLLEKAMILNQKHDYIKAHDQYMKALNIFKVVHKRFSQAAELDEMFKESKDNVQSRIEEIESTLPVIKESIRTCNGKTNINVIDENICKEYPILTTPKTQIVIDHI